MSLVSIIFRVIAKAGENKKAMSAPAPEELEEFKDISFTGKNRKYEKLDIYRPKAVSEKVPVILNVHGGGWVYGTKESYRPYCLYLAKQGFGVVNMNYYLAPGKRFPTQLGQINQVLGWMQKNAGTYFLDMDNLFLVGDSAGAQMVCQYAAILTNPRFAQLFPFTVPKGLKPRAVGLNGGTYEIGPTPKAGKREYSLPRSIEEGNRLLQSEEAMQGLMHGLMKDYLGKDAERLVPMLDVKGNITSAFPPAFLMTSYHDFLKVQAQPMCDFLRSRGVEAVCRCYGTQEDTHMTHVCHTNMKLEEAAQMNLDELAFFRERIR